MKKLTAGLVTLFLFSGCIFFKKDDPAPNMPCTKGCAVFNITVSTGSNATPVSHAYVDLEWSNIEMESFFGGPTRLISTGYTDQNGKISFAFKALSNEFTAGKFTITAKATADYFTVYKSTYNIRNPDTVWNAPVHLPSVAHLNLVYKNFDPTTSDDFFDVNPSFNFYGSDQTAFQFTSPNPTDYPNTFFFSDQKPFDSLTFTGNTAGDQYTYFQILIKRNGTRIDARDSIFIPKGGVGTYRIDYQHSFQ